MDTLWGNSPLRPENAKDLTVDAVKNCSGNLTVFAPDSTYDGPALKPKGKWVEVWPDQHFDTIQPNFWANSKISETVGVISGFNLDLSMKLLEMGFTERAEIFEESANIAFINGPNLNLLGEREPEIYGKDTLEQIFAACKKIAPKCNYVFKQSNNEGDLVTLIQNLRLECDAIIINAGAYTHTSIAIHDALRAFEDQIIELHLSNPHQREAFRHVSYVTPAADALIAGFGAFGYQMALTAACSRL